LKTWLEEGKKEKGNLGGKRGGGEREGSERRIKVLVFGYYDFSSPLNIKLR